MDMMITGRTLNRLPQYLNYLKFLPKDNTSTISATAIAEALRLNDVQVRKDLAAISDGGKPKIGYSTECLILDLEKYLGHDESNNAILIGVGNLGYALMAYKGFSEYGLNIIAGFDVDEKIIGIEVNGKKVLSFNKLSEWCDGTKTRIGIIAVPAEEAQDVCDALIKRGISAIWNFAPVHLSVPEGILVQNENMAASLVLLSKHLKEKQSGLKENGGSDE